MIKLLDNLFMSSFEIICEQAIYGSPKLEKDSFVPMKYSFSHISCIEWTPRKGQLAISQHIHPFIYWVLTLC